MKTLSVLVLLCSCLLIATAGCVVHEDEGIYDLNVNFISGEWDVISPTSGYYNEEYQVYNSGTKIAKNVKLVGELYSSSGNLISTAEYYIGNLDSGESKIIPLRYYCTGLSYGEDTYTRYTLYCDRD